MTLLNKLYAVIALSAGFAGVASADEVIRVISAPVDVSSIPAVAAPVTGSPDQVVVVPGHYTAIPLIVPVNPFKDQAVVAWKKMSGTVQSVDRYNRTLIVQDREGKEIQVAYNSRIRIYRNGGPIDYSAVEPNDRVDLKYDAALPKSQE